MDGDDVYHLELRIAALEAQLENRDALIASYRQRELNQQKAAESFRMGGSVSCPAVSPQGDECEHAAGHIGSHTRRGDGVVRSWGG